MKWKLPFTGKSKIERRVESIEGQIGKEKEPSIRDFWIFRSIYSSCLSKPDIFSRLDHIEDKVSQIVEYLGIERETTSERTFYRKKVKKTKGV